MPILYIHQLLQESNTWAISYTHHDHNHPMNPNSLHISYIEVANLVIIN